MAKKYLTPDFDVTVYEVKDVISLDVEVVPGDPDGMESWKDLDGLNPQN